MMRITPTIPAVLVQPRANALCILRYADAPLDSCYGETDGGAGDLVSACAALQGGATIWVDRRGGAYLRLRRRYEQEAAHAHD